MFEIKLRNYQKLLRNYLKFFKNTTWGEKAIKLVNKSNLGGVKTINWIRKNKKAKKK